MIRSLRLWVIGCVWAPLIALPLMVLAAPAPTPSAETLSVEQRAWLEQRGELRVGLVKIGRAHV